MKIAILGAGALGSILGAHLARSGEEVILIARARRAEWIQAHGITVTGLADFTVPVQIAPAKSVEHADVLIVAVKTYHTESALESVSHLDLGCVLSVQNGVLKNEQLARFFGWEKTLGAAAEFSGEVLPTGVVRFTFNECLHIGELPAGTSDRVRALAEMLERAGIRARASPHIQTREWSKYAAFVGVMPVAALTRLETHRMFKDPSLAGVIITLQREIASLAKKLKIPLTDGWMSPKTLTSIAPDEAVARVRKTGEEMEARGNTAHRVSALQDLENGRPLEVEEILGYAVRKGLELGVPLPTVGTCYKLLTGINDYLLP